MRLIKKIIGIWLPLAMCTNAVAGDSLWCNKLYEIIKAVSTDNIALPVANYDMEQEVVKTAPLLKLFPAKAETIEKKYGKVSYEAITFISSSTNTSLSASYERLLNMTRQCLQEWHLDTLPITDHQVKYRRQYLFTNSEDETTVRIDIIRINKMYAIRFRVL